MLRKLFNFLANMGVWIRLNDPRHEPVSESGRAWGPVRNNFCLSIQALSPDTLSVLIKNQEATNVNARIPGWLAFYRVSALDSNGARAPLKSYGQGVLDDPHNTALIHRTFPAGKSLSTEIPLAALFHLPNGQSRLTVTCPVPGAPGAELVSNDLIITR